MLRPALVLATAAALVALVAAAPAGAAATKLASGSGPGVAIDSAGRAHVVFNVDRSSSPTGGEDLGYCRVARGARRCTVRRLLRDGAVPGSAPALVRAGTRGRIDIVSYRAGRSDGASLVATLRSLDGGNTFSSPLELSTGPYLEGAFGVNDSVALVDSQSTIRVQHPSLNGPFVRSFATINRGTRLKAEIVVSGGRALVISGTRGTGVKASRFSGFGSPQRSAGWTRPRTLPTAGNYDLATGPRGVFWLRELRRNGRDRLVAHRMRGTRPSRGVTIPGGAGSGYVGAIALAQDPARGRMVAVWWTTRGQIRAAASATGRRWSRPRVLASRVPVPLDIEAALGPDGRGMAVISDVTGDAVRGVPLNASSLLRR